MGRIDGTQGAASARHNNKSGENTMSLNKSAIRRLSLLAGASFAVASLTAPAFAADTTVAEGETRTTAITASPTVGNTDTINILGTLRPSAATNVTNVVIQGSGAGAVIINNDGRIQGSFNFTTATGPITVNNTSGPDPVADAWHTGGTTTFGSGADLIDNAETGVIATTGATIFNFAAGSDSFVNAGRLIVDRAGTATGTLTLSGLETFDNSGLILLGSPFTTSSTTGLDSDGVANDKLIAQGVAFTGSGESRIAMDAILSGVTQADCTTLTAADCVDFTGGSTAGSTQLLILDAVFTGDAALNEGITLIVGSSAAGHFTLDPNSDRYVQTSQGGAMQKGLVAYHLVYDADNQSHMLVGIPADEAFQGATFAASAQETWRATTGSWFDRQADLRATPSGLQSSNGLWARAGFGVGEREVDGTFDQGGTTYAYDVGHSQRTAHLVFGADILGAASQDSAWVVGVMAGIARSDVEYDATPTEVAYTGFTGGLYTSWIGGPLFIDAALNGNVLDLNAEVSNMNLDDNVNLTQTIKSVGGQLEAGWRIAAGEGVFIEPLAGLSYVRTRIKDIDVPGGGGTFDFEDSYTSSRVGAGLRVGMDSQLMGMTASWSLTGRYWNEFEGENAATILITNGATSTPLMDDFSGGFGEIAGSINLFSDDGAVSGFVNLGGKFADGYQSVDGAIGVRMRW